MSTRTRGAQFLSASLGFAAVAASALGFTGCSKSSDSSGAGCLSTRAYFEQDVWSAFMGTKCTKCHTPDGVAVTENNAKLVLQPESYPGFIDTNLATLTAISNIQYQGQSELLLKPIGQMAHGGGAQIVANGPEYQALVALIARLNAPDSCPDLTGAALATVTKLGPADTLRKATLDLAGRLPTSGEFASVQTGGEAALDAALDGLMKEDNFAVRVKEIWNDTLLTDKFLEYGGAALDAMNTSDWPGIAPYKDNTSAQYMSGDNVRVNTAIAREPVNLVAYVLQNDRPFTEILTADYALVNPFSAKAYGLNLKFKDPTNELEFQEAKLTEGNGNAVPHAGILSTVAFLNRWQTTPTNRSRGRARRVFSFFLATDVLKIAERPVDATAVTAEENPTLNSEYCTVCHKVIDPVAGGFRGWDENDYALFDPMAPWHDDMFAPGFGPTNMDASYYSRAVQWLATQVTNDPRFLLSSIYTVYTGMTGRPPIDYPKDATVPTFQEDLAAWSAQDAFFRQLATSFSQGFNLKAVFKAIIESDYYRGTAVGIGVPPNLLAGVGTARLLTPEMLNRQIIATTGVHWRAQYDWANNHDWLLSDDYNILYGGIDSDTVPTRLTDANGVVSSVAFRMANEHACHITAFDFSKPQATRTLFPNVSLSEVPESAGNAVEGSVDDIKKNIQYLHYRLLGETLDVNDPEITRTFQVFLDTWHELNQAGDTGLQYECQAQNDPNTGVALDKSVVISDDKNFTLRSWIAVTTYLLSDYKYLYE